MSYFPDNPTITTEIKKIDSSIMSAGYFTLSKVPESITAIDIMTCSDSKLINRDIITNSETSGHYQLDHDLSLKKVYIKNGITGGPTDLSEFISLNDVLVIEYQYNSIA